jgi:hypothetical protein
VRRLAVAASAEQVQDEISPGCSRYSTDEVSSIRARWSSIRERRRSPRWSASGADRRPSRKPPAGAGPSPAPLARDRASRVAVRPPSPAVAHAGRLIPTACAGSILRAQRGTWSRLCLPPEPRSVQAGGELAHRRVYAASLPGSPRSSSSRFEVARRASRSTVVAELSPTRNPSRLSAISAGDSVGRMDPAPTCAARHRRRAAHRVAFAPSFLSRGPSCE